MLDQTHSEIKWKKLPPVYSTWPVLSYFKELKERTPKLAQDSRCPGRLVKLLRQVYLSSSAVHELVTAKTRVAVRSEQCNRVRSRPWGREYAVRQVWILTNPDQLSRGTAFFPNQSLDAAHFSFVSRWSDMTVAILRWKWIWKSPLFKNQHAFYEASHVPDYDFLVFNVFIHSWDSTRLDSTGVYAFPRPAIISEPGCAVALWFWFDSTPLDSTPLHSTRLPSAQCAP